MEVCVRVGVKFRLFPLILGGSWQQSPLIHPCTGRPAALVPLGVEQAVWDRGSTLGLALPCQSTSRVHLELCLVIIICLTYTILVFIWSEGLGVKAGGLYSVECKCLIGFICVAWICSHLLNFPSECTVQFASLVYTALWKRSSHCDESIMAVWLEKVTPCALMPPHPRYGAHKWELSAEIR